MSVVSTPALTFAGTPIDRGPASFGELVRSDDIADAPDALRERFARDGYLFLPGLLRVEDVRAARRSMLERLAEAGHLAPEAPLMEGVVAGGASRAFDPALTRHNPAVEKVLYDGPMMAFMERFFGEPVRHFDYTWVRCKGGEAGRQPTYPHYDITYMGRGTDRLVTAWTPMGDVPWGMGGLIVLENSHRHEELKATYGRFDVDAVCTNREGGEPERTWEGEFGWYSSDAFKVQRELGGRWLSAEYAMGDVLVFSMYTMHASLDNHTDRFRLSTDSRYQPAALPVDERWIGDDPPAHGPRAKKELIC